MGRDTPLSADQDVLVDANIFYAIGRPSNPQYQRFRSAVQHAGVVCKLPRRVIGELGGSETDRDLALQVASEMAAVADDLAAVHREPSLGPDTVYREDVDRSELDAPDGWDDDDAWEEALGDAFEEADIPRSKATLTTKTIDGRDYYYLQWREGESVTSQYVAPVNSS